MASELPPRYTLGLTATPTLSNFHTILSSAACGGGGGAGMVEACGQTRAVSSPAKTPAAT